MGDERLLVSPAEKIPRDRDRRRTVRPDRDPRGDRGRGRVAAPPHSRDGGRAAVLRTGAKKGLSREVISLSRPRLPIDRKSTRLNSSHRCTSYAVFCLKKKIRVKILS